MNCFNKTRRLLKKTDYDKVFTEAKKLVTSEFIILYRGNTLGISRLGLAISKKKVAKASQRNRIKRLLRESFRIQKLPALDIIFLAKSNDLAEIDNRLITTNLGGAWKKLIKFYND